MKLDFLNQRMPDGSRLFTILPETLAWGELREYLGSIHEVSDLRFVTDGVTEGWLHFRYLRENFTIHAPLDEYYVFADNGDCATLILSFLLDQLRAMNASAS